MLRIWLFIFFFDSVVKGAIGKSLWNDDSVEIVGGHDVDIKQYPYQVCLVQREVDLDCGGSILSPHYVLTAAHCLVDIDDPKNYKIRAGSTFYNHSGEVYDILSVTWHPKFNYPPSPDYDVGIIKTEEMAINGVTTKAVQLAEAGSGLKPGATIVVTGWGVTSFDSDYNVLQAASLTVISSQLCNKIWSVLHNITDRMFCAGLEKPWRSACFGDSGGPVVEESSLVQYGIVSFGGATCNTTHFPNGYSNIPVLREWIKEHTGI